MEVEAEVRELRGNLSTLTNTVTRIATIVENSEKRHDSDMATIKDAVVGIKELNDKVSTTMGMKDDIAQLREDIRIARHDLNLVLANGQAVKILEEKLTEVKVDFTEKLVDVRTHAATCCSKIEAIEKRNDKIDGGVKVVEKFGGWLWAIAGGLVVILITNWSTIRAVLLGHVGIGYGQ